MVRKHDFQTQSAIATGRKRDQQKIYLISRGVILTVVALSVAGLFYEPVGPVGWTLDILFRSYVMFLGSVMAHEAVHGHLGPSKATNFFWGRLALLPSLVPYTNFRKTHRLHHAHTNVPGKDPDLFMKPHHAVEIPFRAVAMPHQWFFWLRQRGLNRRADLRELMLNYAAIVAFYAAMLLLVGPHRLFWGVTPALILVSILLWYPFALKTHEGFSTGSAETRSHDYYGHLMYWFSLGLSLHRVHHLKPGLSWTELYRYVKPGPGLGLLPRREMVREPTQREGH